TRPCCPVCSCIRPWRIPACVYWPALGTRSTSKSRPTSTGSWSNFFALSKKAAINILWMHIMTEVSLRPLAGIKVLDLTRVRAGPTAVRQLVDWGADALKIESPAALAVGTDMGGARDTSDFQNLNVGKRSLTLNLKDP